MNESALIRPERDGDAAQVEGLIGAAFGPGRLAKAAERVREASPFDPRLSRVAEVAGAVVGAVRLCPIRIGGNDGAVFLGPIAVDPALRGRGLGKALVEDACQAAAAAGKSVVILVGDPQVFDSMGFSNASTKAVRMPGPVDQRRVMARPLVEGGASDLAGLIESISARA